MFNRYHNVYQINQENVQKTLLKHFLLSCHEISNPLPFLPAITLECVGILKIFCYQALAIRFTYCNDTTCITPDAQKQRSGNQKNRHIRPKPSMILSFEAKLKNHDPESIVLKIRVTMVTHQLNSLPASRHLFLLL